MKKLTKIFATVLTLALAMSTVVMPTTAEAAAVADSDKLVWNDAATLGTTTGNNGKHASDLVKEFTSQWRIFGYGSKFEGVSADIVTYEAQICIPSGVKAKFLVWNGTVDTSRATIGFTNGAVTYSTDADTSSNANGTTSLTYNNNQWYTVAIERTYTGWNMYIDNQLIGTRNAAYTAEGTYTKDFGFDGVTGGTMYVDNVRVYKGAYDPGRNIMPIQATGLTFLENSMTVADAKALALDTQAGGPAAVHVYKDGVCGTEAADTDTIQKNWYVVITSLGGTLYRADGVFTVAESLVCDSVTYADNTVTATVTNNAGVAIESMMMVLVEDGGKFVMSSAVVENITDTATFTITGVDSLSNAEVFFVESWADLAPVMDSTFDVE